MGDLAGRTFVVTGATRGIGRATVEALAAQRATVVLASRDVTAAEDVEEAIRQATANPELFVVECDLAALASVRQAADEIASRFSRIHGLINNAGAFTHERHASADGFELQFAVNHLGHFLLTSLLIESLTAGAPSRVVTVSSRAHHRGQLDLDTVVAGGAVPYNGYQAYADSKLANVLFAFELARRLSDKGVTSNAVHPGVVQTRMLADYLKAPPVVLSPHHLSPARGAATSLYAATNPELREVTGRYFEDCAEAEPAPDALDTGAAARLWAWSQDVVR